jgi:ABC-type multidrug transport system fused ATPase/permease subunit
LVQQEPVLFSGTVYDNVAFGLFGTDKANLPETEQRALIEIACKDAYADEFIEQLPKASYVSFHSSRMRPMKLKFTDLHRDTTHSWVNEP